MEEETPKEVEVGQSTSSRIHFGGMMLIKEIIFSSIHTSSEWAVLEKEHFGKTTLAMQGNILC